MVEQKRVGVLQTGHNTPETVQEQCVCVGCKHNYYWVMSHFAWKTILVKNSWQWVVWYVDKTVDCACKKLFASI